MLGPYDIVFLLDLENIKSSPDNMVSLCPTKGLLFQNGVFKPLLMHFFTRTTYVIISDLNGTPFCVTTRCLFRF